MYGLDADLFMLSLTTHCPKFYLLREDQFATVWDDTLFYKVDIGKLRQELVEKWGDMFTTESRLIDDFVFLCFFTGNDFLHALPSCHNLFNDILFLMDTHQRIMNGEYLTDGSKLNLQPLLKFLKKISKTESASISQQFYRQNFPNVTLNSSLIDVRNPQKGICFGKYRNLYYKKAGVNSYNQKQVNDFCIHYIQGLDWVLNYYHSRPKNWRWFYPYHYTPLVRDIIYCIENCRLSHVSNIEHPPILPFQQLLCVVPPKSKNLLPPHLRPLYNGKLKKYYPEDYELDYEGKHRDWEAIAMLPFVSLDEIIEEYEKASEKYGKKMIRNMWGKNQRFVKKM